jgi:hypothetical protein
MSTGSLGHLMSVNVRRRTWRNRTLDDWNCERQMKVRDFSGVRADLQPRRDKSGVVLSAQMAKVKLKGISRFRMTVEPTLSCLELILALLRSLVCCSICTQDRGLFTKRFPTVIFSGEEKRHPFQTHVSRTIYFAFKDLTENLAALVCQSLRLIWFKERPVTSAPKHSLVHPNRL